MENMCKLNPFFLLVLAGLSSATYSFDSKGPLPRAYSKPVNVDPKLDCAIKELAWDYAKKLLPSQGAFTSAYDALQLETCNVSRTSSKRYKPRSFTHSVALNADAVTIYVDANKGSDSNPGTLGEPVKTVMQGVRLYRLHSVSGQQGIIYLRAGTYYLSETISLGPEDSNLVISGYQNEKATISGGKEYTFDWKLVTNQTSHIVAGVNTINQTVTVPGTSNGPVKYYGKVNNAEECQTACEKNPSCFVFTWFNMTVRGFALMCYFRTDGIWVNALEEGAYSGRKKVIYATDLSSQSPNTFTTLFINGRRAIRARYPDGNPETMGLYTNPTGYVIDAESWLPPVPSSKPLRITLSSPARNGTHFPDYQLSIGGPFKIFDPPESFRGSYETPSGLQYSIKEGFANRTWSDPTTGVAHVFHGQHWGNWQFRIAQRDDEKRTITWEFGGFQHAAGYPYGAEWYVENIMEELDSLEEWFYDEKTKMLYYFPNTSLPETGIGTVLETLFFLQGTKDLPVINITLVNLTFAHTVSTFLRPYGMPSGGGWAIHRGGAIFVEGVDGFLIQNCLFFSPGGNAVFLSDYVRNAVIEHNEFVYTGDSAIASLGSVHLMDGTLGNQPRGTKVLSNLMHEIGIWGKQTAGYFQGLACETLVQNNVMFNGPRAGINFNDGLGGGNLVENNLAFNLVRETGDNGPFNSWDRQPYLTTVRDGTPSLVQAQSNITRNFLINNYHSTWPIDHDDGSCYYYDTYNFLVYGGYKNYLGHSKVVKYNYYIYPDAVHSLENNLGAFLVLPFCANSNGASTTNLPSGWGEVWVNNTCIIGNPNIYDFGSCTPTGNNTGLIPFTANNTFYAPNKDIYIKCGSVEWSLEQFQKEGYDIGSHVYDPVSYDTIVEWGRKLLGL